MSWLLMGLDMHFMGFNDPTCDFGMPWMTIAMDFLFINFPGSTIKSSQVFIKAGITKGSIESLSMT